MAGAAATPRRGPPPPARGLLAAIHPNACVEVVIQQKTSPASNGAISNRRERLKPFQLH